MDDQFLRLEICKQAGFTIDEALLVYKFVTGDDEALMQLRKFREWKSVIEKENEHQLIAAQLKL